MLGAALCVWSVAGTAAAETVERGADRPLEIALLGTSLTKNGGWDVPLAQRLAACLGKPVAVSNFGGAGKTSRWGLTQVDAVQAARPDVVVIEFSANDASLLKGFSIAESAANAETIARRLSGGETKPKIILAAMNPMHGLRGWIRPWLDHYYDAYGPAAERVGAAFLDLRPHWRALGPRGLRAVIPDGVHPKPELAADIVSPLLRDAITRALGGECAGVEAVSVPPEAP